MDENTKFSIRDYREMLYDLMNDSKKEQKKVMEKKYF